MTYATLYFLLEKTLTPQKKSKIFILKCPIIFIPFFNFKMTYIYFYLHVDVTSHPLFSSLIPSQYITLYECTLLISKSNWAAFMDKLLLPLWYYQSIIYFGGINEQLNNSFIEVSSFLRWYCSVIHDTITIFTYCMVSLRYIPILQYF